MKLDEKQNALRYSDRRAFLLNLRKPKLCFSTPFRPHSIATASVGRIRTATATTTSEMVDFEIHQNDLKSIYKQTPFGGNLRRALYAE